MSVSILKNRCILLIRDEPITAMDLVFALQEAEAIVIGPVSGVGAALDLVACEPRICAGVLDINVGGKMIFPVADALVERAVPFIFESGESSERVPQRFAGVAFYQKPIMPATLVQCVAGLLLLHRSG